jgi:hypothetical protein
MSKESENAPSPRPKGTGEPGPVRGGNAEVGVQSPPPTDRKTIVEAPDLGRAIERARLLSRPELVWPALVVFIVFLPIFSRLIGGADPDSRYSDHLTHVRLTRNLARRGVVSARSPAQKPAPDEETPPHPLFHYCVLALSFGDNPKMIGGMAAVVLALALGLRAYLTGLLFTSRTVLSPLLMIGLCLALALAMPLPNWWQTPRTLLKWDADPYLSQMPSFLWNLPSLYFGQMSPNVWHNPTGIFAMPFALLLFFLGLRALESPRLSTMAGIGAAMVLSLLAKPNYVLAFAPCFGVAVLIAYYRAIGAGRIRVEDALGHGLVAFGPAVAVLLYQYRTTFGAGRSDSPIFAPFTVWSTASPHIPISLLLGIAFPLAATLLYVGSIFREPGVVLSWAVLAVAVAMYVLVSESGERAYHGNFGWGTVFADQILFVACCDFLLRQPASNYRRGAFLMLGLHVLCGCLTLTRCLFVPSLASGF